MASLSERARRDSNRPCIRVLLVGICLLLYRSISLSFYNFTKSLLQINFITTLPL